MVKLTFEADNHTYSLSMEDECFMGPGDEILPEPDRLAWLFAEVFRVAASARLDHYVAEIALLLLDGHDPFPAEKIAAANRKMREGARELSDAWKEMDEDLCRRAGDIAARKDAQP